MTQTGCSRIALLAFLLIFARGIAYSETTTISVATSDATSVTTSSAELHGLINPGGSAAAAWFEWGTTASLGARSDVQTFPAGTAAVTFVKSLRNLQPHTTYYFRAEAYRPSDGAVRLGDVKTFATADAPAASSITVTTNDATVVASTAAVLSGTIAGGSGPLGAWFEWGTTTSLGTRTDGQTFRDSSSLTLTQPLRNLQPGTTYYFRAVVYPAVAGVPNVLGDIKTFTTTRVPSTTPQTISEVEHGDIKSGYLIITPDAGSSAPTPTMTFGRVSQGSVQSQAGIVPTLMTTDASMFVEIIPSISRNVGVAFANPSASVNAVTLTLRDENGFVLGSPAIVSAPGRQQVSRFLNELFGSDIVGSGFRGSLRMQSATAFAAIGLRFSGPIFSTLPVAIIAPVPGVPSATLIAGIRPNAPQAGIVGGSNALILPQFVISGGWATEIALVNNSSSTIAGRLDLFDTAGNPMAVTLNGETRSTFTYSIPVGGTFVLAPRDSNGQSPL